MRIRFLEEVVNEHKISRKHRGLYAVKNYAAAMGCGVSFR